MRRPTFPMTTIDQLNKRLGDDLGRIGENPRFAWKFAPEIHYYTRDMTAIEYMRRSWADRIGQAWAICQFLLPSSFDPATGQVHVITKSDWWKSFRGEFPYPENGMYYAHPETALPVGQLPDAHETAVMIASIRAQMDKPHETHLRECAEAAQQAQDDHQKEFFAEAENDFPAFWKNGAAHEPGKRGAHVSFGGIDCAYDETKGLYVP